MDQELSKGTGLRQGTTKLRGLEQNVGELIVAYGGAQS